MKLSFVFLCLSLATLSLASILSAEEVHSLSSSKKHPKPSVKKVNGRASRAVSRSSEATKKPAKNGGKVPKKRLKKRVAVTKGVKKTSASTDKISSAVIDSGKSSQEDSAAQCACNKFALSFFPKELVELIGEYLDGSFSVIFIRSWLAAYSSGRVAVDSERHYLITDQDVQASSHGDGETLNLGSPGLSNYKDFHSSQDGRSVFFTGMSQEQASSGSLGKTVRWLVQETGTKGLKSVTLESGKSSFAVNSFELSTNGKTLVSTPSEGRWSIGTTSVYQIKEHGKAGLASKKAEFDDYAHAVSGNGNRILMERNEKEQLEIHDISGDGGQLVLEIRDAGGFVGSCALNNDGSKAAFIVDDRKLYIVDVGKEKGSVSVDQLARIDLLISILNFSLRYDAKDRLYALIDGNLWLVDPSERELVSLEKAQGPQGYWLQSSAISPNVDYIVWLIRSDDKNEKGEYQYLMAVKKDAKDPFMRLCECKS